MLIGKSDDMPNPSILIVEDDPIIAADLEDQLVEIGYIISGNVMSGEEALLAIQSGQPDLVLMDVQLEGKLDGVETASLIRRDHQIPLIFLTSNSDDTTFKRAKGTNPKAFLSKPFKKRDLRHSIELALGTTEDLTHTSTPSNIDPHLEDRIFLKSNGLMIKVMLEDILWVEADDYYCKVISKDKEYLATLTLKKFDEQVRSNTILRVHRSYMVNLRHVDKVSNSYLHIGKHKIPIGRSYNEKLLQRLKLL
jgi:DNA-binding LytR/AlgR family response regulator